MIRNIQPRTFVRGLGGVDPTDPDTFIENAIAADRAANTPPPAAVTDWQQMLIYAGAALLAALLVYQITTAIAKPEGRRRR